ncbi:MAG TPA: THUMP domain-containing protein [Geobacterales bacterium]|nr:THUMP domain-containing protein [Geobacterales bacterium]
MAGEKRQYLATAARGLGEVVAQELKALGIEVMGEERHGVRFAGDLRDCYRANLWLRCANRILLPLADVPAATANELYDQIRAIPWQQYLTPEMTLAVSATTHDSFASHSGWLALKVKDAIVDTLRDQCGSRPSVDVRNPDLAVVVHLVKNRCSISLDSSGEGLDRRGYRLERTPAPLRETLAAGLVMLSGWDETVPLVDPMCGSGTIAIEAALRASHRAPGLERSFGFQRWPDFDSQLWQRVLEDARQQVVQPVASIIAADLDVASLQIAEANAQRAGVASFITFIRSDMGDLTPPLHQGCSSPTPPMASVWAKQRPSSHFTDR